jgi:ATP-dependent DNA helicase RecQ
MGGIRNHGEKLARLHGLLKGRRGANIVYASTRKAVEAVRRSLAARGLPALSYHAGLPPSVRTDVQDRFLHDPSPVVVATNAFGMGIDRADVRSVLHFQLPGSLEAYYQEAGRAGRDGSEARCVALFGRRDRGVHDRFVGLAFPEERVLRKLHRRLVARFQVDEEVRLPREDARQLLGGKHGEGDFLAVLRALARCGAVAFAEAGEADLVLTPLGSSPDFRAFRRLRSIRENQIDAVLTYAKGTGCRRRALLDYFGENEGDPACGKCDRCEGREPRSALPGVRRVTGLLGTSVTD